MWHIDGPQGHENFKIAPFIVPYTRGRGLDLGCGVKKTFPHFLSVDIGVQDGRPIADTRDDATKLDWVKPASQDFIFSSHLLEHLVDPVAALELWWSLIRPGGHLVLYLPHEDLYPRCGQPGANPDHKHDLNPQKVNDWMQFVAHESGHGWLLVEDEVRDQGDGLKPLSEYSFFQVYRKSETPKAAHHSVRCLEQPWRGREKSCLVVRYGGFGDHMMASSALAALKAEGWHVTYNCEPRGYDILREDPHIDAWWVQDTDQVPNNLLGEYWRRLGERWQAVFNLSESIEGALLAVPGRYNHGWPQEVRRRVMGTVNYLDRTHDLCAVPRAPKGVKFYPDSREKNWAHKQICAARKIEGRGHRLNETRPVVLWSLSGSAKHKVYPHQDPVIHRLVGEWGARVVLVGDNLCQVLEVGWEDEPNVWCRSGEWSIRQTLAFAQRCDIVIGPETGVLNAVSLEPDVGKVCILSHSSHENLTRDWVNATVIEPHKSIDCYPCHRMHYGGWDFCRRSETTGVAACASSIPPEVVFQGVSDLLAIRSAAA